MMVSCILTDYLERALAVAAYHKLYDSARRYSSANRCFHCWIKSHRSHLPSLVLSEYRCCLASS